MTNPKPDENPDIEPDTDGPVIIKRYASRKLYDAAAREYVTLEDIARYIRDGREVKIIDKKTNEDLTRQYLVQIIADFESQGESALPLNVLTDLVRHYQDQAQSMTPAFLSQMFDAFKEQQEQVMEELGDIRGKVFDPKTAMETMQSWQEKQAEFFNQAFGNWGSAGGSQAEKKAETKPVPADEKTDSDDNAKNDKIAAMEAHLKALQDQLNKLR